MPNKCPQCGAALPAGALEGLCPACLLKQGAAAETGPEAAPFQPPSLEEMARLFPQLEILAFIGKGGMGAVYKARQPALDRIVALKILPPQVASGPGFAERFNREARALARLNHPNIVAVHEFGQVNDLPFFIMEFVDGLNLRQLERAGKLSPREALQIVPQICEALQFAHDEGIVHRDIKPENILLDKKGRVKIADFGIAKIMGREPDLPGHETEGTIGTPHYMAPEQVEKPEEVDHRADIFALGVVFYEMLTGELPLGKFAPPSRKVGVDVRLDEVVLRALEKEPERRYQHASQVKTAVDTIAGTTAPPPRIDPEALADEIRTRDYTLDIGAALRCGWALVTRDFWPTIGVTAVILLLMGVVGPFGGPFLGGLWLYFLKKARGERATIETAFSGCSIALLQLFLAGLVVSVLTVLGFVCCILPGIYLVVAWMFPLALVIDKRLDFWPAMELSRKVVTKHWWKFFGFALILALLNLVGCLALGVGIFITFPITMAALACAYEGIFGTGTQAVGVGPSGTAVMPDAPPKSPGSGGGWKPMLIGLAAVLLACLFLAAFHGTRNHHRRTQQARETARQQAAEAAAAERIPSFVFGPVIERTIQARETGTNQFLDLDTGKLLTPPSEITNVLAASHPPDDESRFWQALDIPTDSRRFQYIAWLRESGADLMFAGDGKIIGFDSIFPIAHGHGSTNWDDWNDLRPEQVYEAVKVVDWSRRATEASRRGQPVPPGPTTGGIVSSAAQLDSQAADGPIVNLLTREQSVVWFFKTREGGSGVLQIAGVTDDPPAVKIRYKLMIQTPVAENETETLATRLDAAETISSNLGRDQALTIVALDAAKAGEVAIVKKALGKIGGNQTTDEAALQAVRILAKRGLRKQAIEIAKSITGNTTRDMALSELAR